MSRGRSDGGVSEEGERKSNWRNCFTAMKSLPTHSESSPVSYRKWLLRLGVSSTTGWRWVKNGWIQPFNIAGRLYLTREEIERFESRANNGEFAKSATGAAAAKAQEGEQ